MSDIFVANETFTTRFEGSDVVIRKGKTRIREGHPLLRGREHLFTALSVDYDIEQATKAPGEKRSAPAKTPRAPRKAKS